MQPKNGAKLMYRSSPCICSRIQCLSAGTSRRSFAGYRLRSPIYNFENEDVNEIVESF